MYSRSKVALLGLAVVLCVAVTMPARCEAPQHKAPMTSAEALNRLKAGNQRFVDGKPAPKDFVAQRTTLVKGQHPYAIVLGCADSRVSPTVVFDESLGQVFEVRVAGGIAEDQVDASIEYAADHLNVPLVVVLGHDSCGVVRAALSGTVPESIHLRNLVAHIEPALKRARKLQGEARVAVAVEDLVRLQIRELVLESKVLSRLVKEGKVRVVGAIYHLDSGKVEFLSPP